MPMQHTSSIGKIYYKRQKLFVIRVSQRFQADIDESLNLYNNPRACWIVFTARRQSSSTSLICWLSSSIVPGIGLRFLWRVWVWRILSASYFFIFSTVSRSWISFCSSVLLVTRVSSCSFTSWASFAFTRLISWSIYAGASTSVSTYFLSSMASCFLASFCSNRLCWEVRSAKRCFSWRTWSWRPSM